VGDLTQKALKMAARMGLKKCLLAGQMGRVAKLALQKMDPQTQAGPADLLKLAALALQAGASEAGGLSLSGAGTARRAFEAALGQSWGLKFFKRLCHKAADNAFKAAGGGMKVEVWLVDYEGKVMAKASCGKQD
jgi:cobalt-precorrin-5B (C1)-methyltransferase